jgi:hypothetical protein
MLSGQLQDNFVFYIQGMRGRYIPLPCYKPISKGLFSYRLSASSPKVQPVKGFFHTANGSRGMAKGAAEQGLACLFSIQKICPL